jgi:uncharacterized protein (DUF1800 family)
MLPVHECLAHCAGNAANREDTMAQNTGQSNTRSSRRRLLHTATALAAAAAVHATANTLHAQDEQPPIEPAPEATPEEFVDPSSIKSDSELRPLRSPERVMQAQMAVALPPVPPLAVIALNRIAFGNRPGDPMNSVDAFNARPGATPAEKLQHYVDEQLSAPPPNGVNADDPGDTEVTSRITPAKFPTLFKSLDQLWLENFKQGDRSIPLRESRIANITRAAYSKWQLREVMVDFWHNHFNVFAWDYYIASSAWPDYDRVIRAHTFGNFRAFLEATGRHRAMLFYLDQYISEVAGPNENYARELFELHGMGAENYLGVMRQSEVPDINPLDYPGMTIGIDPQTGRLPPKGYVDDDVYEATRCFTGWTFNDDRNNSTGAFVFDAASHDRFQKTVLRAFFPANTGISSPVDGQKVYDLLANHPGTAKFIAHKLCRRLIADDPPESVVNAAAAVFYNNRAAPDQIKQTLRAILLSQEFQTTWAQKVKRPFDSAAAMLRAVMCSPNSTFAPDTKKEDFYWRYDATGQSMFARRSPDGYPDISTAWRSTTSLLMRWRLCNWIIEEGIPLDRTDVRLNLIEQMPGVVRNAQSLAKYWCERIFGVAGVDVNTSPYYNVFVETRNFMAQGSGFSIVLADNDVTERVPRMVALILQSPDFQWR